MKFWAVDKTQKRDEYSEAQVREATMIFAHRSRIEIAAATYTELTAMLRGWSDLHGVALQIAGHTREVTQ